MYGSAPPRASLCDDPAGADDCICDEPYPASTPSSSRPIIITAASRNDDSVNL